MTTPANRGLKESIASPPVARCQGVPHRGVRTKPNLLGPFDVTAFLADGIADSPATGTLFSYYLSLLGGQASSVDAPLPPVFASSERVLGDINALAGDVKSMGTQSGSGQSRSAGVGQLLTDLRADPLTLPLSSFFTAVWQRRVGGYRGASNARGRRQAMKDPFLLESLQHPGTSQRR